ncbi:MAG: DUF2341 domain-containing protein [Bacteroidales bacterium]
MKNRSFYVILFFFLFLAGNSLFAQSWYNASWNYRKSHTVNSATGAGTNYQVMVTVYYGNGADAAGNVYCNSLCKTDFTDIRFTSADGTTLLSHWIQSTVASNNAVFWVKIASDLSSSSQTIYMYYGNAAATTVTSGTNTFIFYDDGSTTSGWTTSGTVGSSNVQGNPVNSLRAAGSSGSYLTRNTGIGPNTFTFFNVFTVTGNLGNFFFQCNASGSGQMYRLDSRGNPNFSGFATTTTWTAWTAPGGTQASSANTWYRFGIAINASGTSSTLYYNSGTSTNPVPGTVLGTYTSTNSGTYIGLVGDAAGGSLYTYWDNIITRKYVSPEPAHASWGAVESTPTITNFTPSGACQGVTGIVITGTYFTGATNVAFNGTSASFVVNNATQITATVPLTATTGAISVTTPAGTANSIYTFLVTPASVAPTTITGNSVICGSGSTTLTVSGGSIGGPPNIVSGLVAYYQFISDLNDYSVSGLNLSGSGGSFSNGGLQLTAASAYTSATTGILNTDNYSMSFYMKYTANPDGNWRKIFGYDAGGSDRSPGIWRYPAAMQLHWRHDPGNTGLDEAFVYTLNQWYYITGVKNGSTFTLYVDGVQVSTGTVANPKAAGSAALWFGGADVVLREFKIFNRSLSNEEATWTNQWAWYTGSCGGTPAGTGPSITATPAATSTYYVRAEGACTITACASQLITLDPLIVATVTNQTNPYCNNGNDGTITITVNGGTPPFYYSVDNGLNWTSAYTPPPAYIFGGLSANIPYRIKVKDSLGCESK